MNKRGRRRANASTPRLSSYSKDDFMTLASEDAPEIIKELSTDIKRFQKTLENADICKANLDLIIKLLLKVSSGLGDDDDLRSRALNILGEVLSDRCTAFQDSLKRRVCLDGIHASREESLTCICRLFEVLLNKIPDASWGVLPVDELLDTIKILIDGKLVTSNSDLLPKAEHLVELRDAMKDQHRVMLVEAKCMVPASKRTWDNSEYRTIQILPQWEEISNQKPPYQLRKNIVDGRYDDWMHYYDIQFRLLREDFISPLRKGIGDYLHGKVGRDLRNVKVYHGLQIKKPLFTRAGLCYEVRFDPTPFRGYRWEHSRRLIFGSLLCISPDHFHSTVLFAVVSNSDPRKLAKGFLEVMFQGSASVLGHIKLETKFVMVESLAYYEASRHILQSLQNAEVETMPFTKYLIENECCSVLHPKYLNKDASLTTYNIQFIIKQAEPCTAPFPGSFTNVAITDDSQWPALGMTDLDESQLRAMKMALTQEIAVIQGPPGTGKTYMGLKIVQALLANRRIWNRPNLCAAGELNFKSGQSPILVMCFTNHALDQFLEGILDMHGGNDLNLIRIGGRSKSEKIQECSLYKVKRKLRCVPRPEYVKMKKLCEEAEAQGAKCMSAILAYEDLRHFVAFNELKCVIEDRLYWSLIEPAETAEEEKLALELWLGLCVKEVHEEFVPIADQDQSSVNGSEETSSSYDDDSSSETEEDMVIEETINISGDASIEVDQRMIDGLTDMFEEMTFESSSLTLKERMEVENLYNIRRTFRIVKNKDAFWVKRRIMRESDMSEKAVQSTENVHTLKLQDRYKLYKYWHLRYRAHLMSELEADFKLFNEKCEEANMARQRADRHPLEKADVIGMTTTGAAKYQHILHMVKPKIVIVEEAAEVLESHIVSALNAGTQHLILIGDHKQLRPNPNEYDLVLNYKLDISLFERLVQNDFPHVTLQIQHRMRPEIADLVRGHIYDVLHDHKSVESYPKVRGVASNLFLIQHDQPEKGNDLSHSNEYEAEYLAALCNFLLQQGYSPSQITVLVTYSGQLLLMKKFMPKSKFEGVRVSTVDNFQGEENDIILLSLVRSNKHGVIGFLKAENRICVALSRAKHGFYCMGNFEMLRKHSKTWQNIVSDMQTKGKVGEGLTIHCNNHPEYRMNAKFPGDFAKYFPTGGCPLPCGYVLECGHVCALTCHSSDPEHEQYQCKMPVHEECLEGHTISRLCFEESKCTTVVERTMPHCGHLQQLFCCEDPYTVSCREVCLKTMPECGHSQEMLCWENPLDFTCQNRCNILCPKGHTCPLPCYRGCKPCRVESKVQLPLCGHTQLKYCYQEITDVKCNAPCEKTCKSGHQCQLKCYQDCRPCSVRVKKTFSCGHAANIKCSEQSLVKCEAPCPRRLSCDHECPLTCGQLCEDAACPEAIEITLPKCKHKATIPCHKKKDYLYRLRFKCTSPCQKILTCGHSCAGICGEPCIQQCEVIVYRTCPQGHQVTRRCFQTLDNYPCDKPCKKKLSCGHVCQNSCSEICTFELECKSPTTKKYPCGHEHRLPCSTAIEEHPCDIICRAQLACGHTCRGKCSECRLTRVHKPCSYSITQPHFCGETVRMNCVGLQDTHGKVGDFAEQPQLKLITCMHRKIPCECGKEVSKCLLPCEWSCPHHKCTKLCHEICDRQPCDNKCPRLLGCGHQCVGLCGEPCIEVCPECDPESFSKLFTSQGMPGKFSTEQTYIQLPCGHIFTVQNMDDHVSRRPSCDIGPLQCPDCSALLSCSYRYGNPTKKALFHVEAVRVKVQSLTSESNMPAKDRVRLSEVISNLKLMNHSAVYSDPLTCLNNFKRKLDRPHEVISKEAGFVVFLLTKAFAFAVADGKTASVTAYQPLMNYLVGMTNQSQHLSYQIIQDLLSELYRLCCQLKLTFCRRRISVYPAMKTLFEKEHVFLSKFDQPNCRMSKKDFTSHSRMIDIILGARSTFESTNEFIKDVEHFQPSIFSGCWQKCAFDHYYCIPVCKPATVNMQCPECTGTYVCRFWN